MEHNKEDCIFCKAIDAQRKVDACMEVLKKAKDTKKLTKENMDFIANDTFILFLKHCAANQIKKN